MCWSIYFARNLDKGFVKYRNIIDRAFNAKEFNFGYTLMEKFPNFQLGFCMSTHKSQGSTYETAFVIASNIMNQKHVDYDSKLRAMYVAMSRPKTKLYLM